MKNLFLIVGLIVHLFSNAQPLITPQQSPTQTIIQNFGTGNIELSYSRPGIKGRQVFGDLVPFGKVWRTGANDATTIQFSEDVKVFDDCDCENAKTSGIDVKAGKYGLLSIPGKDEWTLIITKDLNITSPSAYKQENDVARIKVKPATIAERLETFTMIFANVTNNNCDLVLLWDNTAVALGIAANTDSKVMTQIDNIFNKDTKPYFSAAQYYFENNKDIAQAKEWIDKAIAVNAKAFWMTMLKARILEKMGDKTGARAMCEKTITLATEQKNDDYIKMAKDMMKKL